MKHITLYSALAAACFIATAAYAAVPAGKICTPKANSYTFLVDYSGSMMESPKKDELTQKEKEEKIKAAKAAGTPLPPPSEEEKLREKTKRIATAKAVIEKLNASLTTYALQSSLYSIAPYTQIAPYENRHPYLLHKKVQTIKENMEVIGRRSPIGLGIELHAAKMESLGMNGPVYLITDGRQVYGRPVADSVKKFYAIRPESCLHVVSLADTKEGEDLVAALTSGNTCSRVLRIQDIDKQPQSLAKFIEDTMPMDCVEPEPILSIRGINFAFDKYNIDKKSEAILQKALQYIHARDTNEKIEIIGWTDWMGSDAYNMRLSQNRAESVKAWLIKHGIPAERMKAVGKGKSYLYDNRTKEGRYLNRRMDFRFYTD